MEKEGGGEQLFGVVAVVLLRDAARTVSAAHRDARGPRPCIDSLHFITSRPSPPVYCKCDVYQGFSLFSPSLRVQQQLEKYLKKKKKKKTSIDYIDEGVTTAVCRLSWKKEATHILFFKTFSFDPFFSGATPVNLIDIIFLSYYFLFILCAENYRNHYAVYVWVVLATV